MEGSTYTSLDNPQSEDLHSLLREYFYAGYTYNEMILILYSKHGISISLRHLNRELRELRLFRRNSENRDIAVHVIQKEISGSGCCFGYRSMCKRLLSKYGISISRKTVAEIIRTLDPEGVQIRRRRSLTRRVYVNKGPNYLIHVDGYDKLKRYGFPIHGAVDGFSRRVLWLRVASSNNDPRVVGTFFLDYINEIKGVPRCIRIDGGTENTLMEDIQMGFRWDDMDDMAGDKSIIKGSSHSNQRIERWWLSCRQGGCQFWMTFFADMENFGLLSTSDSLQIECLRFCFTGLIQKELDTVRAEWNQHSIRPSTTGSQSGKPDIMYFLPSFYGSVDYRLGVNEQDLRQVDSFYRVGGSETCSEEITRMFTFMMSENGLQLPTTAEEAVLLYGQLMDLCGVY